MTGRCSVENCDKPIYNKKRQLCTNCYGKWHRLQNIEHSRELERKRAKRNRAAKPEKYKNITKKSYRKNNEKRLKEKQEYYELNRDSILEYKRVYSKNPRSKKLSRAVKRKREFLKSKACPIWADLEAIKQFYLNCPEGYHVDHIIPIKHDLVCGLHTIENLQYLPSKLNIQKSNKFDGTLENNSWRQRYVSKNTT